MAYQDRVELIGERRASEPSSSSALIKGTVAHQVLKICGREWMTSASMPADLRSLVAPRLPRSQAASHGVWE
jgi:hypothetical protein